MALATFAGTPTGAGSSVLPRTKVYVTSAISALTSSVQP